MTEITKKLKKAIGSGQIVSIYFDNQDPRSATAIRAIYVDFDFVFSISYDLYGKFEGFGLIRLEDIFQVSSGTKEERKINNLAPEYPTIPEFFSSAKSLFDTLQYLKLEKILVDLRPENLSGEDLESIYGFITKVTDDTSELIIECVDEYGQNDGCVTMCLDYVQSIYWEGSENEAIMKLREGKSPRHREGKD